MPALRSYVMTAAPLLSDEQIDTIWRTVDNSRGHYKAFAHALLAAAQSHFDRTLAERDWEIERLTVEKNTMFDESVRRITEWRKRSEAAEIRAAEAEKDAGRYRWICKHYFIDEDVPIALNDVATEEEFDKCIDRQLDALRAEGSGNG
jgi:hypothetical protein